jgi:hypothetical protein
MDGKLIQSRADWSTSTPSVGAVAELLGDLAVFCVFSTVGFASFVLLVRERSGMDM